MFFYSIFIVLFFPIQSVAQVSGIGHSATDWLRGTDVEKFASQAAAAGPPHVCTYWPCAATAQYCRF